MTADLRTLLHATAPAEVAEVDYEALARRGTRRRIAQRVAAGGTAALVLLAGASALLAGIGGDEPTILDRPQDGVLGTWEPLPDAPLTPRWSPVVVARDERVLVIGGQSLAPEGTEVAGSTFGDLVRLDGAVFDAEREAWTPVPAPPMPPVSWPAVAFDGERIALLGGETLTAVEGGGVHAGHLGLESGRAWQAAVWQEDSGWRTLPLPEGLAPRDPQLLTWSGDRLVVFGGSDDTTPFVDGAVWTEAGGWSSIPGAPLAPRTDGAVAVVGDHLVVWGGLRSRDRGDGTEDVQLFDDGAVFDLEVGTWSALPAGPLTPRWLGNQLGSWDVNVRVDGERILIAGGAAEGSDLPLDGAWLDLASMTWTPITPAPDAARYVTSLEGGTVAAADDQGAATLWRYDELDDAWDRFDSELPGGSLELAGVTSSGLLVHSIGHDGQWQDSPRLGVARSGERMVDERAPVTPRWKAAIAPLPDGALVWGGMTVDADGEAVVADQAADGVRLRLP